MSTPGNRFVTEEADRRREQYERHGGGLASAMRRSLGVQAVRKQISIASGLTGKHRAALNVAKSLLADGEIDLARYEGVAAEVYAAARAADGKPPANAHTIAKATNTNYGSGGPDDHVFEDDLADALIDYAELLTTNAPLSQVNEASARVREAAKEGFAGAPPPASYQDGDTSGAVTQDSIPSGRGHGEGEATVVRKDATGWAAELIEKSADEVADAKGEAEPLQVLARAQATLLDTFRSAHRREPGPQDDGYWQATKTLLSAFAAEVKSQEASA